MKGSFTRKPTTVVAFLKIKLFNNSCKKVLRFAARKCSTTDSNYTVFERDIDNETARASFTAGS